MATEKKPRTITPVGEAKWCHLVEPKAPFKDAAGNVKGEPKYQLDVVFDTTADPAWLEFAKGVSARLKAIPVQIDKHSGEPIPRVSPIKRELDADDNPTGRHYITFKTSVKFRPPVFDRRGVSLEDTLVGNGSKVRVAYVENQYPGFGGGLNFYLQAVQVVELIAFGGNRDAGTYGFTVDDTPDTSFDVDSF